MYDFELNLRAPLQSQKQNQVTLNPMASIGSSNLSPYGATETVAFSASKDKFGVETADVVVKKSQIVRQDWELSSGLLVANPRRLNEQSPCLMTPKPQP